MHLAAKLLMARLGPRPTRALTARQARFVELYTDGPIEAWGNATRSAEAAGYPWPSRQGPRLLTMPAVRWHIEARQIAELGRELVRLRKRRRPR